MFACLPIEGDLLAFFMAFLLGSVALVGNMIRKRHAFLGVISLSFVMLCGSGASFFRSGGLVGSINF